MTSPIERILVPLDPSDFTRAATLYACEIAKKHYSQIRGLAVLDTPEIRSVAAPVEIQHWETVQTAIESSISEASSIITEVQDQFKDVCEQQNAAHSELSLEGVPAFRILEEAGLFDLLVMGLETHYHFETRQDKPGDSLDKILDRTSTPVLAVPTGPVNNFKRVLLAYDGSLSASRAVRDFSIFAQPFEFEIQIFTAESDRAKAEHLAEQVEAHLRSHRLTNFSRLIIDASPRKILEDAAYEDIDLVVAGIHAKRFLVDKFLGSFAQSLIDDARKPLFLSH